MPGFEDFQEGDWRTTFDELRLLVISSGFSSWDAAMVTSLGEQEERTSAREDVLRYAQSFARFLKVRSSWNLERMASRLSELVLDEQNRQVRSAELRDQEGRAQSVLLGQASDALLNEVNAFANAVGGETGYFNEEDPVE